MDRANIIHDLLNWIETHLDQPLLLDNVAAKSGYSKWHLQRMFRSTTGHALGSYIRERRLSKAAQALRSTPRPILDIALQYHFDSQPSFSRAFKKQFGKTPAVYRRSDWDAFDDAPLPASAQPAQYQESPGLQLLYAKQCVDGKCSNWVGQR
ncbi:Right origin-binding protein [Serratia rubidaea]|uniref:Helix-turn-helix domain-containing protein n=1 Tax=Serratia rubidaea TaxID=61652 RepID=A0A140EZA9_SERRU|nr:MULTISPECIES: helix-turn-helix domain-containing protein [Serratia]AGB81750.1 transcriptional regulator containing an amidase domain and an AraC-type DNA-binding HTH domain [Serratia sp. FGI94]AML59341.1 Right origin-binding protein [Serratia rubidaea]MBD8451296.1 helix-turn-helix domain-containing protein [Serratia rubidaea]MBH1928389.1 helix-turn-helix domain-containing protein [Serratia rubidaea]MBS0973630.1 helix-turn-helix domain-containing protein [Serratia rubidaea]